jgi:hypothetical protein
VVACAAILRPFRCDTSRNHDRNTPSFCQSFNLAALSAVVIACDLLDEMDDAAWRPLSFALATLRSAFEDNRAV